MRSRNQRPPGRTKLCVLSLALVTLSGAPALGIAEEAPSAAEETTLESLAQRVARLELRDPAPMSVRLAQLEARLAAMERQARPSLGGSDLATQRIDQRVRDLESRLHSTFDGRHLESQIRRLEARLSAIERDLRQLQR